jgi:steroid delta-isomerase-like uncharacterized protein
MSANNKELVRRFFETAFVQHNLEEAAKMMAASYVLNDPSEPTLVQGIDQWKQMQSMYLSAFPDHHLTISHQLAEDDLVLTHWSVTGTQVNDLPGVPATQRPIHISGMTLSRVANGKISEEWQNWDSQGLLEQLGFNVAAA